MAILLLDNYDSFTYNLYDYIRHLGYEVDVIRNDILNCDDTDKYSHIVLSPGPGLPQDAGCMMDLIGLQLGRKPIFGVCLGMQALAIHLGDTLYNLKEVRHGREMKCRQLMPSVLLQNIDIEFQVGLYHSWAITGKSEQFDITSISGDEVIMSMENKSLQCFGVQFHPESIMTPQGKVMLKNFLDFETVV
jgi:anthranilate synthase component II